MRPGKIKQSLNKNINWQQSDLATGQKPHHTFGSQLVPNQGTIIQKKAIEHFDKAKTEELAPIQRMLENSPRVQQTSQLQSIFSKHNLRQQSIQRKENDTGLPDNLKSGVESLSGYSMEDVKVNYNSSKPSQLNALAYTQGTDIHLAPGQEKHLGHEAWHVVQQKQGRVKPSTQLKDNVNINHDAVLEKEADVMGQKIYSNNSFNRGLMSTKLKLETNNGDVFQLKPDARWKSLSLLKGLWYSIWNAIWLSKQDKNELNEARIALDNDFIIVEPNSPTTRVVILSHATYTAEDGNSPTVDAVNGMTINYYGPHEYELQGGIGYIFDANDNTVENANYEPTYPTHRAGPENEAAKWYNYNLTSFNANNPGEANALKAESYKETANRYKATIITLKEGCQTDTESIAKILKKVGYTVIYAIHCRVGSHVPADEKVFMPGVGVWD